MMIEVRDKEDEKENISLKNLAIPLFFTFFVFKKSAKIDTIITRTHTLLFGVIAATDR